MNTDLPGTDLPGVLRQIAPTPNEHKSAHDSFCEWAETEAPELIPDMAARRALGLHTYGTTLQPYNGRNQLIDAYQELLDALAYLEAAHIETGSPLINWLQKELARLTIFLRDEIDNNAESTGVD